MDQSALQKQNSIFHRQLAEVQQEQLHELRTGVFQTTKIMVSIQDSITSSQSTSRITQVDGSYDLQNNASTGVSACPIESSVRRYRSSGQAAKSERHFELRLQAPFWMKITNRGLGVSAEVSPFSWNIVFKGYSILHEDAPIMKFAQTGNIKAIQELFNKREASPNDRTWRGETVLGVS
jgi:hypothetical protein